MTQDLDREQPDRATGSTSSVGTLKVADPSVGHDIAAASYSMQLAFTRLARRLRREVDTELTPSQLSALSSIRLAGPLTLGELAECERVAPPSITRMVARLEEEGYVTRVADAQDRRVTRVVVTERAETMVTEARRRKAAWLVARIEELPEDQRGRLLAAVDSLEALAGLA